MIVAFDLDGTLCNIEHRLHFIRDKPSNWPAFFRACADDKPVFQVIRVAEAMRNAGHTIEVWSGRSDAVREQTEFWLHQWGIGYHTLRMRKDGDYRADNIVKSEWFDSLSVHERPALAFDDRQQVVNMWRSRGVLCAQVAPGDF
jgi:phosphoglycolate phosphatase-like HAD superfamily hydrolase